MDLFLQEEIMQCYIGCSGFYNKDWKKIFYPEGLPQSKWFEYYCSKFNTLELNTTFYRFPRIEMLQKWYEKSPADFVFSVKVPRLITHYKQLNDTNKLLEDFYTATAEGLKEKLGAVLFQFPAKIIYSEDFLQRILDSVNKNFINVVEFRHQSWWNENVYSQLAEHNISFCGISIKNLPDAIIANTKNIYYRFHGLEKLYFSQYPFKYIKSFGEECLQQDKIEKAFIYFNNTANIAAINNAKELMSLIH